MLNNVFNRQENIESNLLNTSSTSRPRGQQREMYLRLLWRVPNKSKNNNSNLSGAIDRLRLYRNLTFSLEKEDVNLQ